jgi:pimeloyl-ACP methyl ester carboxylesterase
MRKAYADIPEGQIHYRTEGEGHPLLLLHYIPVSSEQYTEVIPHLSPDYRVIAMDIPGYGMSDKPPHKYSIEDYARSIISFLDALKIKKTHIAGHHIGAALAIELATTHPERLGGMILSGVSLYTPEESAKFLKDPLFAPLNITAEGAFLIQQWGFLRQWGPHLKPEITFRLITSMLLAGQDLHKAHYSAFRYQKEHKLPQINNPVLLVSATGDMFHKNVETVKKMIPNCRSEIIEAGNFLGYEKPEEFARAILKFLKTI